MARKREEILIVRIVALGDVATTSTLLTRIRMERPNARVTWLTGQGGASLVRMFEGVDEIIEVDEDRLLRGSHLKQAAEVLRTWQRLGRRFDLILVAHADPRYRLLFTMSGAHVRSYDTSLPGKSNPIPGRFFGDEAARLLDDPGAIGFRPSGFPMADLRKAVADVRLPVEVAAALGSLPIDVAIIPGGARNLLREDPLRRWPLERYAVLAERLLAAGHRVVILGGPGDEWVHTAFSELPVLDLVGRLDIPQTLHVLSKVRVAITHDTGPLHFARLVRARTVALFGPTTPRQVIGNPEEVTVLWGGESLPCRPCYDGREFPPCQRNHCMEQIEVATVFFAATRAMALERT